MTMPSAPTWVDILTPTQCPCCGQAVMPTPQDYLDAFTTSMDQFTSSMSQWVGGPTGMATGAATAPTAGSVTRRHMRQRPGRVGSPTSGWGRQQPAGWHTSGSAGTNIMHGLRHVACHDTAVTAAVAAVAGQARRRMRRCRADDCHCQCCIGDDLDLVVYSRLGERRIVPITITNERRREREVTLELSGVQDQGRPRGSGDRGDRRCEHVHVGTLRGARRDHRGRVVRARRRRTGDRRARTTSRPPTSTIASSRSLICGWTGCDIRCPIGIGVVLLPRDCDTFDLGCGCGCC